MLPQPPHYQATHGRSGRPWAIWSRLVFVVMALGLMFDGGAGAMSLTHAAGTERIVICAEGGAKSILVSASGEPAEPMWPLHDCGKCPKCNVPTSALVVVPVRNPAPVFAMSALAAVPFVQRVPFPRFPQPQARGPPSGARAMRASLDLRP